MRYKLLVIQKRLQLTVKRKVKIKRKQEKEHTQKILSLVMTQYTVVKMEPVIKKQTVK